MTNSQHANENLTIHHKVRTTPHGARVTMNTRRAASPPVLRMGECSAVPKTRMMW